MNHSTISGEGSFLREQTKETISAVITHLRSGMAPKEIASLMRMKWSTVQMVIYRHRIARAAFIETHPLRHPDSPRPPDRIVRPFLQANCKE